MKVIEFITSAQFLIFIFTVVAAWFIAYSAYKDGKIRDDIQHGIVAVNTIVVKSESILNESAIKLSENLEETKMANEKLQKTYETTVENLLKTIEIKNATIELQKEILGQITGGDSYPKISLKDDGFYLSVEGAYSIPNLKVHIQAIRNLSIYLNVDIDRRIENNQLSEKIFNFQYDKLWKMTPFAEEIQFENIGEFLNQTENHIHGINIVFQSEYKKWQQYIRLISHKGKWEIIDVLVENRTIEKMGSISDNIVYNRVSELYPINNQDIFKLFISDTLYYMIEYNTENSIGNLPLDYFNKK